MLPTRGTPGASTAPEALTRKGVPKEFFGTDLRPRRRMPLRAYGFFFDLQPQVSHMSDRASDPIHPAMEYEASDRGAPARPAP